jgi:hypothetical protein
MSGQYFDPAATQLFPWAVTATRSRGDLLAEIGELYMQIAVQGRRLGDLEELDAWIQEQPVIFTQSICCEGKDLLRRIRAERIVAELRKAGYE